MDAIALCRDYAGNSVYHQVYVDRLSGKTLIVQSAVLGRDAAEIFGTMRQPEVPEEMRHRYWEQFQETLRARGVKRIWGKVPSHLITRYSQEYGVVEVGQELDPDVGMLVIVEKTL